MQVSDGCSREYDLLLQSKHISADVMATCTRDGLRSAYMVQSALERHVHLSGSDLNIILDLHGTDCVFWGRPGHRNHDGPSPKNSISVIPAHQEQVWYFTQSSKLHVFVPDAKLRRSLFDLGVDGDKADVPGTLGHYDRSFANLLRTVYTELTLNAGDTLLQSSLHESVVAALISRYIEGVDRAVVNRERLSQALPIKDARLTRALDFINDSLGSSLSIEEIASVACLSPSHFTSVFRTCMGETPYAYVLKRRVEAAREMIVNSPDPLSQIAYAVGFSSQAHMTTAFRRVLDVTPGQLRDTT